MSNLDDSDDRFHFEGDIVRQTELAYLLDIGQGEEWFPKSQIEYETGGWWSIPNWMADEKSMR